MSTDIKMFVGLWQAIVRVSSEDFYFLYEMEYYQNRRLSEKVVNT